MQAMGGVAEYADSMEAGPVDAGAVAAADVIGAYYERRARIGSITYPIFWEGYDEVPAAFEPSDLSISVTVSLIVGEYLRPSSKNVYGIFSAAGENHEEINFFIVC